MSDKTPETAATPAAAPKKSRAKLLIIGVAVLVLGGGGFAYWTMQRASAATAEAANGEGHEAAKEKEKAEPGGILSFEPFIVNLADTEARRFLRISVRLLISGEAEAAEEIEKNEVTMARLRSDIVDQLTQQTSEQISSPEGKAALKKTIGEHAKPILEPIEVIDVLFSDVVVQY